MSGSTELHTTTYEVQQLERQLRVQAILTGVSLLIALFFSIAPLGTVLNAATIRSLLALSLAIAFMRFTKWSLLRHQLQHEGLRLRQHAQKAAHKDTGDMVLDGTSNAAPIIIVFASQTGYAEQLAQLSFESLTHNASSSKVVLLEDIATFDIKTCAAGSRLLFIASTTGEGDAPDSAANIVATLADDKLDLSQISYAVLALGDKHYQAFCAFGHQLDRDLHQCGAQRLFDLIEVDNGDEHALRQWQSQLAQISGHHAAQEWQPLPYQHWTLVQRKQLNLGSLGHPVMWIRLQAHQTEFHGEPQQAIWQAGDILEVFPGPAHETVATSLDGTGLKAHHREYSIASVVADGYLDLVVRQAYRADGSPGLASSWLNTQAQIGDTIAARIRSNRSFHAPHPEQPMILIGNGTGIAGLRAHLKHRLEHAATRNWLIFGERQRAHDFLFAEELQAWQEQGHLTRLDLAFSRDQEQKIYVQDKLREAGDELRRWIADGAVIYVCGSLQGMANEVDQALREILGDTALEQLRNEARYRRDVY